jgi:hypothetical protein
MVRGGYGFFYDGGTLIENSALYFNPPFFRFDGVRSERAAADGRQSVSDRQRLHAASVGEHACAGVADRLCAAGQRRRRCRIGGIDVTVRWVGAWGSNLVRKRNLNQP